MSSKKKVLIICPFATPNVGGVESHLDKLIYELNITKKYYVTLITYQPLTTDSVGKSFEQGDNYEIHRMKWFGMDLFPKLEQYFPLQFIYLFPGLFFKSVIYYLRNYKKIDVIHAHGLVAATVAVILKFISNTRIVLSTHAIYDFKRRGLLKFFIKIILSPFDYILAVSDVAKQELIDMGLPEYKLGSFRNWIDTDLFKPNKILLNKHSMHSSKSSTIPVLNVLFVGRFIPHKGIMLLLEAAVKLTHVNFHFVGTGPLLGEVIKSSKEIPNVVYHGVLMQSSNVQLTELIELYSSCDYLISPYLYDEGYSTTLIESLSCGTPVIVPDRGSPPAFLNNEVAVFLSHTPDVKELVNLLSSIYNSYSSVEMDKLRKKCRVFAVQNFGRNNVKLIMYSYEKTK
jgi:glycosyltransferase involved in cell wall biosynthesis